MKRFETMEIEEAYAHAAAGGQALHCHRIIVDWAKAPGCFKAAIAKGEDIAHLFDQDAVRLVKTVRRLGVRIVVIEGRGEHWQHVDLCGGPLRRALSLCDSSAADGIAEPRP